MESEQKHAESELESLEIGRKLPLRLFRLQACQFTGNNPKTKHTTDFLRLFRLQACHCPITPAASLSATTAHAVRQQGHGKRLDGGWLKTANTAPAAFWADSGR